jgi:hypothetical protein
LDTRIVLAILLATTSVAAQDTPAVSQASKPQLRTGVGTVKLVAADMVTVTDRDGKDWSFAIDTSTKVVPKGASHAAAAARKAGEPTAITDLVKDGQRIRVRYFEMDGKLRASEIRVI